jgi:cobalamin-dependent methionine synthase I
MRLDYSISDVAPYINWIYFFHAWGGGSMPSHERSRLQAEARERLLRFGDSYQTHAVFEIFDAHSEGDDIVVVRAEGDAERPTRIPCLRQQQAGSDFLCLADFVCPESASAPPCPRPSVPPTNQIGVFATTVDIGLEKDFSHDPYEQMMMQLLADRLAEATAERMHEEVRKRYWGYAADEQLSIDEMLQERWQGIRPAVGYPSLPDTSLNFVIDRLIDMKQTGIRLTESGAMKPHASVSGLMLAHPAAHYFSIGKIGDDQLADYARRRDVPVSLMRKFLGGNL